MIRTTIKTITGMTILDILNVRMLMGFILALITVPTMNNVTAQPIAEAIAGTKSM